jgi:hypothetical protein
MMPSSPTPSDEGGGGSGLRRWGPIAAIVAVLAIVAGVVVLSGGDDDDDDAGGADTTIPSGEDRGAITFAVAEEEGLDVTFEDACNEEDGRLFFPSYFRGECYANVDDNGGATDDGVTADTIRVAIYLAPDDDPILDFILGSIQNDDTAADVRETYEGLTEMFNDLYQTYGRTVEPVFIEGSGNATDAEAGRADAIRAAEEGVFAAWGGPALNAGWSEELNARGIVCLGCFPIPEPEPNVFTVTASQDQVNIQLAEYIDVRLAGNPAQHAGDEALQDTERVFGHLWLNSNPDSAPNAQGFSDLLGESGVDLAESIEFDIQRAAEQAAGVITRLKDAGVTSVIIQGDPSTPAYFTEAATQQDYFPEWIIGGSALMDTTAFARSYDQEQWSHAFGISTLSARTSPDAGGPLFRYDWYHGEEPAADETVNVLEPQPLIFFGALQVAGPELTTESLVQALYTVDLVGDTFTQVGFAYGDHGYYPTLEPPDHNGIEDATEIWWDPEEVSVDEIGRDGPGSYMYVDGGRRFLPGSWEEGERAFDPEGAVSVYEEAPEAEQIPDFDPPGG